MNEHLRTIVEVQDGGSRRANWFLAHGYVLLDIQVASRERRGSAELRIDSKDAVFTVGITAGTSTPIETVNEAVAQVKELANVR